MNIPRILLIALITFFIIPCEAQIVKTKDGVSLGSRKIILQSCIKGAKKELMNLNGLKIETKKYCACVCDNLIPRINSSDLNKAVKENKMEEFMMQDENFEILMSCVKGNVEVNEDYKFGGTKNEELYKKIGIKSCVNEIMNNKENKEIYTQAMAEQYCDCAITKLYSAGYTYKDILEVDDENSASFNEIILPCVQEVLQISEDDEEVEITDNSMLKEIVGGSTSSIVPLIEDLSKVYKVKISISGVTKYFIFDTGASDLIINRDTERELLLEGVLKKENYLGKKEYILANNETMEAQEVRIDNITIGDYTLNNVVVAIIDEGSLLCGKSFLDKFKKWEIDKENKELILYK